MIDRKKFMSELSRVFSENGISSYLSFEKSEKFLLLTDFLISENKKYNLTAIDDPDKIILHHYADCAAISRLIPHGAKVTDIGCGAGFPSLPLAIIRDDITISAIDSTGKKIEFVRNAAALLSLHNISAECMRAEDGAAKPDFRETSDTVVSRAMSELRILAELGLPYVKVGGTLIAMKGRNAENEVRDAKKSIAVMGGVFDRIEKTEILGGEEILEHRAVIILKKSKTPAAYPRPYSQIVKKPL